MSIPSCDRAAAGNAVSIPGHPIRTLGALIAVALLSACASVGESGLEDEWARIRGTKGVAVISLAPDEAVFAARGRRVVVLPSSGHCVSDDAVDVSSEAAFLMLTDCSPKIELAALGSSASGEVVGLDLPASFPGIVTISVSADPLIEDGDHVANALDELEAFLATRAGRKSLSRHKHGEGVTIVEIRRIADALYVLVQEGENGGLGLLSPRYWRAYVELNRRLSVVSVSALRGTGVGEAEMLAQLARQVVDLRHANGEQVLEEEARLAEATGYDRQKPVVRRALVREAELNDAPGKAPRPPANPRLVYVKAIVPRARGTETAAVSGHAPRSAPRAPRRPRG